MARGEAVPTDMDSGATQHGSVQVAMLRSDMSAFKAANPGCVFEDFVRWHSPRDWDESEGRLSDRMAAPGNLWDLLWAQAPAQAGRCLIS